MDHRSRQGFDKDGWTEVPGNSVLVTSTRSTQSGDKLFKRMTLRFSIHNEPFDGEKILYYYNTLNQFIQ